MEQQRAMTGVFDRAAPTYDGVGVELFGPVAQLLVDALEVRAGERVLDIGCGRGAVLLRAARLAGSADGLDLSSVMVQAARDGAAQQGLTVDVRVDDAVAPDRPAGSYDVVASSLVLFFLPDPAAALRTWRELLAPDGRLGVTTFGAVGQAWRELDVALMAHAPAQVKDARTSGAVGPFASDEGVEQLLTGAGLRDVRTVSTTVPVRFTDPDHWYRWTWSIGQRVAWESLPEADRPAARSELEQRLEAARCPDGQLGFDQVVRATLGEK